MTLWSLISSPFRRGPRRPLAARQPARPNDGETPLGMEAMDMSLVASVNRRNASLERVTTLFTPRGSSRYSPVHAETSVTAMPDDETYAARYHSAFTAKKGSDTDD